MIDTVERPPAASRSQPRLPAWTLRPAAPPGWLDRLVGCHGGFFHTNAGLLRNRDGAPFFAEFGSGGIAIALAAGVWTRCRLSPRRRHVYLPTYPALADPGRRDAAFGALVRVLREAGAADLMLDSFAASTPAPNDPPGTGRSEQIDRLEYVVELDRDEVVTGAAFSEHHRRHLKRAERCGWRLHLSTGDEGSALLAAVQTLAAARAARRGDPFAVPTTPWTAVGHGWPAQWGEQVFAVYDGSTPLSAALVGWANRRAYSLSAGSTADGYALTSSAWLHWRIMRHFAAAGFTSYNLGGAPEEAQDPQSPAHGLHRFKMGFAPDVVRCRTIRWVLRPAHEYAHAAARRAKRWLTHEEATG
ncbi:MAG TPA: GNAT family N-acetyltransferase [Gaiellales bacterium]|nr:GNAT family N-acetyltransferase [Gaiellales bacterium]